MEAHFRPAHSRSSSMLSYDRISEALSDDDEIVWSVVSESVMSNSSIKDDFVFLSPPPNQATPLPPAQDPNTASGNALRDLDDFVDSLKRLTVESGNNNNSDDNNHNHRTSTPTSPAVVPSSSPRKRHARSTSSSKSTSSATKQQQKQQSTKRSPPPQASSPRSASSTPPVSPKGKTKSKKKRNEPPNTPVQSPGGQSQNTPNRKGQAAAATRTKKRSQSPQTAAVSSKTQAQASSAIVPPSPDIRFVDRSVVDDYSDTESITSSAYEDAVNFMTSFLTHPSPSSSYTKLTVLQSLIIELGLVLSGDALPTSVKAATSLLKSKVFINVRDYLAVRSQGQEALQRVMHPSRRSLVSDLRRKGGKNTGSVPLDQVKGAGLNVFLVSCYYR